MGNPLMQFENGCRGRERTKTLCGNLLGWHSGTGPNRHATRVETGTYRGGTFAARGHEANNYVMVHVEAGALTLNRAREFGSGSSSGRFRPRANGLSPASPIPAAGQTA